jgi:hypothetical protein
MGVSNASVERAAAVKRADPVLHQKVKAGEVTAGKARTAIAKPPVDCRADTTDRQSADRPLPKTVIEVSVDKRPDVDAASSERDRAIEAITAVARLKISGTAARNYQWSDGELRMAEKAAKWLKMFNRVGRSRFNSTVGQGARS